MAVKITHRPSGKYWSPPESDFVDAAYETQVRECTDRGEREYARLQHRLAAAETRLAKARSERKRAKSIAVLVALVEMRRAELDDYRRLMVSVPASAEHRGTASFRPVPSTEGIPL